MISWCQALAPEVREPCHLRPASRAWGTCPLSSRSRWYWQNPVSQW